MNLRGDERFLLFQIMDYQIEKIIKYQNINNSDEYKNLFSNQLSFSFEEIVLYITKESLIQI